MADKSTSKNIAGALTKGAQTSNATNEARADVPVLAGDDVSLACEISKLKGQIISVSSDVESIRSATKITGNTLLTRVEQVQSNLTEQSGVISRIDGDLVQLRRKMGQINADNIHQTEDIRGLVNGVDRMKADLNLLSANFDVLSNDISGLKRRVIKVENRYFSTLTIGIASVIGMSAITIMILFFGRMSKLPDASRLAELERAVVAQQQQLREQDSYVQSLQGNAHKHQ